MATRVPEIASLEKAIEIYYSKTQLGNRAIKDLFVSPIGSARVVGLKEMAFAVMAKKDVMPLNSTTVDTACAFEAWGLDIEKLERNYIRLKNLGVL